MNLETLISAGYYLSSLGFLVATIVMFMAVKKFGKSAFGSVFSYILIGTGIFFVITVFQKLGSDFFMISEDSVDIWWHILFYMAVFFYFFGIKALVGLMADDAGSSKVIGEEKKWGILAIILLVIIFIIPKMAEPAVSYYANSGLAAFGLHHFLAFILAGFVGYYLVTAKKNLGQIGRAIANPMIIAIWALSIQHFWELLNESWAVIDVSSNTGEGVEKIFLIITAVSMVYAGKNLISFAKAQNQMKAAASASTQASS